MERDPCRGRGGIPTGFYIRLGEEFVKKLYIDQEPRITTNARQLADWLARGIYPISLGAGTDRVKRLQKEGFPVAIIYNLPDMRARVSTGSGGLEGLMNKAPHPNAARVFVNWMASKEGLEIYSRAQMTPTTRSDLDESFLTPETIPRPGVKYFDSSDWYYTVKQRTKASQRIKEILKFKR